MEEWLVTYQWAGGTTSMTPAKAERSREQFLAGLETTVSSGLRMTISLSVMQAMIVWTADGDTILLPADWATTLIF
ncbi:hypothetical protein ASF08_22620 [Methylobacterium sp. Leaf85]|nr:hypothetical protein ASF08_22620 [Methylobacterium sp. Leaf85]